MNTKNSVVCPRCHGTQFVETIEFVSCDKCNHGVINCHPVIGTCIHCIGLGKIPHKKRRPCSNCVDGKICF